MNARYNTVFTNAYILSYICVYDTGPFLSILNAVDGRGSESNTLVSENVNLREKTTEKKSDRRQMVDRSTNTDISGDILPLSGNVLNPSDISLIKTEPQSVEISDCIQPKSPCFEDSVENILINNQSMEQIECTKRPNSTNSEPNSSHQKIDNTQRKRRKNPNFCIYCKKDVWKFARHLQRTHYLEPEVIRVFSTVVRSPERNHLLSVLRKKGNFLKNREGCQKPVRTGNGVKYAPCKHCLGFYSSKLLARHVKNCKLRKNARTSYSHLTDAQNLLLMNKQVDRELVKTVFPKMFADDISFEAKSDPLICMFGARYHKTHKEKHFVNVCSRKMRELARLLIEIKKQKPSIKSLFDAFRPENFHLFVQGTKVVAKYDPDTDECEIPGFATKIRSYLKQCCDIAITTVSKKKQIGVTIPDMDTEKNYKAFKQLLENSWRFAISAKIRDPLKMQKSNDISVNPLVQDVKELTAFLQREGEKAYVQLETEDCTVYAYKALVEIVFCRLLLLNRVRAEELEKMFFWSYISNHTSLNFSYFVTPTEKILLNKFKNVVLTDTLCRDVPIIFTSELQKHTDKLLEMRTQFVPTANVFLFPEVGTKKPIEGQKIFKRHCCRSEVKNCDVLISEKLDHLVTVSQLFAMSNNDLEQLQTCMADTHEINRQVETLPIDVQQVAKISRILLLLDQSQAQELGVQTLESDIIIDVDSKTQELRGKTVDGIDVVLDVDAEEVDRKKQKDPELLNKTMPPPTEKKKKILRKPIRWTEEQKSAAKSFFSQNIANKKPPKKREIEKLRIKYNNLFHNKTWPQIKVFVQNIYKKNP